MSIFLLISLFLGLSFHGIECGRTFSSIQGRSNADEYDCVDIYKQPAFDHVLLKNHKIQMAPSFTPEFNYSIELSLNKYSKLESHGKGCPEGRVPILRPKVNLKDLNSLPELHRGNNIQPLTNAEPGKHFAMVRPRINQRFYGARATISLDNPPVKMNQISAAQIWLEEGQGAEFNRLQVGWAVHPRIYGDASTRLTGYWTADGSQKTGCYNALCPGFVQVHRSLPIGGTFGNVSGSRFATHISIFRDGETGNWWLVLDKDTRIGYWPKELFSNFDDGALSLQFGGWTFPSPDGVSPPMGTGRLPNNNLNQSSFFVQLGGLIDNKVWNDIFQPQKFADNTGCYDAIYFGNQGGGNGQTFTFGGPGGQCGT